jgi:hypothetical protein
VPELSRPHDVSGLTAGELERTRRELAASLALAAPGSPVSVPILAQLSAIDAELTTRTTDGTTARRSGGSAIRLCSCGFASSDGAWFDGHLFNHPGHDERNQPRSSPLSP